MRAVDNRRAIADGHAQGIAPPDPRRMAAADLTW
jgi:hypothetical protein